MSWDLNRNKLLEGAHAIFFSTNTKHLYHIQRSVHCPPWVLNKRNLLIPWHRNYVSVLQSYGKGGINRILYAGYVLMIKLRFNKPEYRQALCIYMQLLPLHKRENKPGGPRLTAAHPSNVKIWFTVTCQLGDWEGRCHSKSCGCINTAVMWNVNFS